METSSASVRRSIEAVWRIESARVIGGLARLVKDVGLAEDLAQEALVAALELWPATGVPDNPGAWLATTARNRGLDHLRRQQRVGRTHDTLAAERPATTPDPHPDLAAALDEPVRDDVLRLLFVACHPVLTPDARVALTLRMLAGLTTEEIARAFLVPEATVAQRIVRAKRTLTEAKVPFEVPPRHELGARVSSVMGVVYLVFNEGYSATRGEDWMRPALCDEAMRLGRILVGLVPGEPEVHGLLALMELQASRTRARTAPDGAPILLLDQDRSRWDQLLLRRGLAGLATAEALAQPLGPYTLQAAIAACHARARTADATDWKRIVALYDALAELTQSPVVELNRAVAVAMAFGPEEGLALVEPLRDEPALRDYHLLPAVRGDLLFRAGHLDEARAEFERAAFMTRNARERATMLARAKACG